MAKGLARSIHNKHELTPKKNQYFTYCIPNEDL